MISLVRLIALVVILSLVPSVRAQFLFGAAPSTTATTNAPPPEWIASPKATIQTFLESTRGNAADREQRDHDRAVACLELGEFGRLLLDDARVRLIDELRDVLVGLGVRGVLPQLPDQTAAEESKLSTFALPLNYPPDTEPLVLTRGVDSAWRFSEQTLIRIEGLHDQLLGQDNLPARVFNSLGLNWLVTSTALGLSYATWIGLFGVLFIGALADLVIWLVAHFLAQRYLKRHGEDTHTRERRDLIKRTAKPFGFFAGGCVVYALLPLIDLPLRAEGVLRTASKAFFLFALIWAAYRVVDLVAERFQRKALAADSSGVNTLLIPLMSKAVKMFILALGLIFVAESLNMPITSLLAGVGIGGIALAVAARGTLENVFGTVSVTLDRPFRVGDWVKIGDIEGNVEQFSLRSTRVRTYNQSLVTVPNATLVSAAIENYGMREYRRTRFTISLTYDTAPAKIEQFCEAVRGVLRAHPRTRKENYYVFLSDFSPSSLDVLVSVFLVGIETWDEEYRTRHELLLGVMAAAQRIGVSFAFPTTTLHLPDAAKSAVKL